MAELKPCPFCGSDEILFMVEGHLIPWEDKGLQLWYRCHCYNCGVDGRDTSSKSVERAIEAWNRRAGDGNA